MAGKRGHGEGSVYKRQDGRWAASVTSPDGRRRTAYRKTQREANQARLQLLRDVEEHRPAPSKQTVGEYLDAWLASKTGVRANTLGVYTQHLRLYIRPELGDIPLAKLTSARVQQLVAAQVKRGLAPRTIQTTINTLRNALNRAVAWELVPRNVANAVELPRQERREVPVWSPEEVQRLIEAAREERLGAMCAVALGMGLRFSEVLGLRWTDLDLDRPELRVTHRLETTLGPPRLEELKTRPSYRTLPIPGAVAELLRDHRRRQLETRLACGGRWEEHDLVFCTRTGKPLAASNIRRDFRKLVAQLGLPKIHFYDQRHVAATLLAERVSNPQLVMRMLGHSQSRTTFDIYTHVRPPALREAADAMDAVFRPKPSAAKDAGGA